MTAALRALLRPLVYLLGARRFSVRLLMSVNLDPRCARRCPAAMAIAAIVDPPVPRIIASDHLRVAHRDILDTISIENGGVRADAFEEPASSSSSDLGAMPSTTQHFSDAAGDISRRRVELHPKLSLTDAVFTDSHFDLVPRRQLDVSSSVPLEMVPSSRAS